MEKSIIGEIYQDSKVVVTFYTDIYNTELIIETDTKQPKEWDSFDDIFKVMRSLKKEDAKIDSDALSAIVINTLPSYLRYVSTFYADNSPHQIYLLLHNDKTSRFILYGFKNDTTLIEEIKAGFLKKYQDDSRDAEIRELFRRYQSYLYTLNMKPIESRLLMLSKIFEAELVMFIDRNTFFFVDEEELKEELFEKGKKVRDLVLRINREYNEKYRVMN